MLLFSSFPLKYRYHRLAASLIFKAVLPVWQCVCVAVCVCACFMCISMQGACVSILCVCICVSVLLHSAISQPPTESDIYTVRMDKSLCLLLFSSFTPFSFFPSSSLQLYVTHFFVLKCWPQILFSLCFISYFLIFFHSSFPFQHFIVDVAGGNFSFNFMFLQTSLFLSMQLTATYFFPDW